MILQPPLFLVFLSGGAEAAVAYAVRIIIKGDAELQENALREAVSLAELNGVAVVVGIAGKLYHNVPLV